MISQVKRIAHKPPTYSFFIEDEPACAIITAKQLHSCSPIIFTVNIFCNDKHVTLHDVSPLWRPEVLQPSNPLQLIHAIATLTQ